MVVWCDGGHALAMLHGSGHAGVVVGVWWWSHHAAVAAWHGSGGRSHGLVVAVAVVLRQLWHGCGSSGGDSGHVTPRWPCGMMVAATWWWQQQLVMP